jgi:hypothetical protein
MASSDDLSKPRRSRRAQDRVDASTPDIAPLPAENQPSPPPRNLEEAIESARTLMLQIRAVLHVLSDVLLHADDEDAVMHAEVARSTAAWANLAAEELDVVKLRPLIEALRQRYGESSNDHPDSSNQEPPQVREPRLVYLV